MLKHFSDLRSRTQRTIAANRCRRQIRGFAERVGDQIAALRQRIGGTEGAEQKGWIVIEDPIPWYAEKVAQHEFALDHKKADSPMRCPKCGAIGTIEQGQRKRCECALAMAISANALWLWERSPSARARNIRRRNQAVHLKEIFPNRTNHTYVDPPHDAAEHPEHELVQRHVGLSSYAPGHEVTIETAHCPSCARHIEMGLPKTFRRWLCQCEYVIHMRPVVALGWKARPVDTLDQ